MSEDFQLYDDLVRGGRTSDELARLVRDGRLVRLRRGVYANPSSADIGPVERHRRLVHATMQQLCDRAVVSYASAAVLHGLPIRPDQLDRVHVTRNRSGGGKHLDNLQVHGVPLADTDVIVSDGLRVTDLRRTVLDLACSSSLERGVAVGDAGLRRGLRVPELETAVEAARRRHGIAKARTMVELVDVRAESPGESISRVVFWRRGLPQPVLQHVVYDEAGQFVARCDFAWPDLGTLGEFDGDVKYKDLLKPGQSVTDVILDEKRREERLRELGWQVVRWRMADLSSRSDLMARLQAAFRRGRPMLAA